MPLIEALAAVSPPQMPISLDWPDAIRVDGVLVGGGRLGWPDGAPEEQEPEWLVLRPCSGPLSSKLQILVCGPWAERSRSLASRRLDIGSLLESFARHLLADFHALAEDGFEAIQQQHRMHRTDGQPGSLDLAQLQNKLITPSWLDRATGLPWL